MATIEHSVQRELSERPARYQGSRFTGRVNEIIQTVEKAQTPQEIPTIKKLRGERNYFRIRIGDYRLGLKIEGQLVTLVRILNRKDIYRYFP